jgi:hypothetical protein
MGSGIIKSNLGDGQYTVELQRDLASIQNQSLTLEGRITQLNNRIALLDPIAQADQIAYLEMLKAGLEQRKVELDDLLDDVYEVSAWCADYSLEISIGTQVGTIEPPGERWENSPQPQVHPGHDADEWAYDADRDGILKPWVGFQQFSRYFNRAVLPAWQISRPTHRYGMIKAIRYGDDRCDLDLVQEYSSAAYGTDRIALNPVDELANVPIVYPPCNSGPFVVGDEVLIRFDQDTGWADPEVIGFREYPKPCGGQGACVCWRGMTGADLPLEIGIGDGVGVVLPTTHPAWGQNYPLLSGSAIPWGIDQSFGTISPEYNFTPADRAMNVPIFEFYQRFDDGNATHQFWEYPVGYSYESMVMPGRDYVSYPTWAAYWADWNNAQHSRVLSMYVRIAGTFYRSSGKSIAVLPNTKLRAIAPYGEFVRVDENGNSVYREEQHDYIGPGIWNDKFTSTDGTLENDRYNLAVALHDNTRWEERLGPIQLTPRDSFWSSKTIYRYIEIIDLEDGDVPGTIQITPLGEWVQ